MVGPTLLFFAEFGYFGRPYKVGNREVFRAPADGFLIVTEV